MRKLGWLSALCSLVVAGVGACGGGDDLTCGEGTTKDDGVCVPTNGGDVTCGEGTVLVGDECLLGESPEGTALAFSSATSPTPFVGGGLLEITGAGFRAANAGDLALTVDGVSTPVFATSDTTAVAVLPAATALEVELTLSNANGEGSLPFRYQAVLGATGRYSQSPLMLIDPRNGLSVSAGRIWSQADGAPEPTYYSIGGMAFAADGTLYAVSNGYSGMLLTIDPLTAEATEIGALIDQNESSHNHINDIAFVGDALYGWSRNGERLIAIDTATGAVNAISVSGDSPGAQVGLVDDGADGLLALNYSTGTFIELTTAGVGVAGLDVADGDDASSLQGMERTSNGNLLAIGRNARLFSIDPVLGVVSVVGTLTQRLDALAVPADLDFEKTEMDGIAAPGIDLARLVPATARKTTPEQRINELAAMPASVVFGAHVARGQAMGLRAYAAARHQALPVEGARVTDVSGDVHAIGTASMDLLEIRANRRGTLKLVDIATGRPVVRDIASISF